MNLVQRNVVLGALAGVLAVPTILQLRRDTESFVDAGSVPLMFDGFTADNVTFVSIQQPKKEQQVPDNTNPQAPKVLYDQLVFQRTDKGWVLAQVPGQDLPGAPVNKERVEADIFNHLRSIRADRETLVRANATPEQLADYGLDDAHAFVVLCSDATQRNVVADLLVGKDAGQGQTGTEALRGVFVRKRDSTDVVLYEFDKTWLRSAQRDQWLDKVLAKLEPDKIQKLSIKNAATGETRFTFARSNGKASWSAVEPPPGLGAVRQTEIENIVQRLRWIGVQDYRMPLSMAGNLGALGLQPGKIEIDLVVKDGDRERNLKLSVGNQVPEKNEFYLQCNESAFVMTWAAGMVTPFEVDVKATCFDPAPPTPDKPGEGGDKKGEEKKVDDKK